MRGGIRLIEALLGASLALMTVCAGLWKEALAPALPGASPLADVVTLVSDFGFSSEFENRLPLHRLEALMTDFDQWSWSGALSSARPVQVEDRVVETRMELVFGPMFEHLGVPLTGRGLSPEATRLPLAPQPVREVVLGHDLASRLFGSPQAALGKTLNIAMMRWMITGEGLVPYRIVGVAGPGFGGASIETPAQLWIGINGWHDVLFPSQQLDELRRAFGPSTVLVRSSEPNHVAQRVASYLHRVGESTARVATIAGAGYHPSRRARFAEIGQGLIVAALALSVTLAACVLALAWLGMARVRHGASIRCMLGEPTRARLRREMRAAIASITAIGFGFGVAIALVWQIEARDLPLRMALTRGLQAPASFAAMLIALASTVLLPRLFAHLAQLPAYRYDQHAPTAARLLFAMLLISTSLAWFAGAYSVERVQRLASGSLSATALATVVSPIGSDSLRYLIDDSSTQAMEELLASSSIALASTGPLGAPVDTIRGTVQSPNAAQPAVFGINHVSHNYFDIAGLTVAGSCAQASSWKGAVAMVNEAFSQRHFGGREATLHRLSARDGREFEVCGVVRGSHALNARAGNAAMIYVPLVERRRLRVALTSTMPAPQQRSLLERALGTWFPDSSLSPPTPTAQLAADQLRQERNIALLNGTMMIVSGLIGFGAALLLGRAAIASTLRAVATRRALGASGPQLVRATLIGPSARLWGAIAAAWLLALGVSSRILDIDIGGSVWGGIAALLVPGLLSLLVVGALQREVSDDRLIHALRAE